MNDAKACVNHSLRDNVTGVPVLHYVYLLTCAQHEGTRKVLSTGRALVYVHSETLEAGRPIESWAGGGVGTPSHHPGQEPCLGSMDEAWML